MALGKMILPKLFQHLGAQTQEPQLVGHGALALPHTQRRLLLIQAVQVHQPRQPLRLLDVIQIPPLQILHQRHHARLLRVHRQQNAGHLRTSGQLCRPQTALSGHQFILPHTPPHRQRLQDPILLDAGCQLPQTLRVENFPRL